MVLTIKLVLQYNDMSCIILKYDDQISVKPERPSNVIEQVVLVYTNLFQFDCEASNVCLCKSRSIPFLEPTSTKQ